jgi:hypothetical protein
MMSENKMDNRGSKSIFNNTVKEQRVDGSSSIIPNLIPVRCTLMVFERNYQLKILSKQLNINKNYSTFNTKSKLNLWFVSGLTQVECSLIIFIVKK